MSKEKLPDEKVNVKLSICGKCNVSGLNEVSIYGLFKINYDKGRTNKRT